VGNRTRKPVSVTDITKQELDVRHQIREKIIGTKKEFSGLEELLAARGGKIRKKEYVRT